jgi:hypothetical protein
MQLSEFAGGSRHWRFGWENGKIPPHYCMDLLKMQQADRECLLKSEGTQLPY